MLGSSDFFFFLIVFSKVFTLPGQYQIDHLLINNNKWISSLLKSIEPFLRFSETNEELLIF